VVNLVRPKALDDQARKQALDDALPRHLVSTELAKAGVDVTEELVDVLFAEACEHAERRQVEDEQRERIAAFDRPTYELTKLADGIDLGGLYELALDLREQGMA
jgi:hypothetical protein